MKQRDRVQPTTRAQQLATLVISALVNGEPNHVLIASQLDMPRLVYRKGDQEHEIALSPDFVILGGLQAGPVEGVQEVVLNADRDPDENVSH